MLGSVAVLENQPISTWFGLGGVAKRMARPGTIDELRSALAIDPKAVVLGDGANLLVADGGVEELVISLRQGEFDTFSIGQADARGNVMVSAGAGVHLFKLINATTDVGLSGLENLAGIPASVGGAAIMNAGGKYGATGDYVFAVHAMDREGKEIAFKRTQVEFTYRHSSLAESGLIVTRVEFRLKRQDIATVKAKLREVTEYKKTTQPMSAASAGCCFKNPTLLEGIRDIGTPGTRVSAGMLIDRAGCKGMTVGGATVSQQHGNFIVAGPGAKAADVLTLMKQVQAKVLAAFKVNIEPEIVIWGAKLKN